MPVDDFGRNLLNASKGKEKSIICTDLVPGKAGCRGNRMGCQGRTGLGEVEGPQAFPRGREGV